ncbi:hypothetical protein Tco_0680758 [Tanacetum coccineum]|uniref:Uncharacterized protein n=1 Tax=Tanacetum coccineum TaxID=301880 RepID=A0ABQ4XLP7_9ASTR
MKIMKLRQNAVKKPRQNAVKKPRQNAVKNEIFPELLSIKTQYGLEAKRNGATKVLADAARIRRGVENVHTYTRRRTVSTGSGLVSTAGMDGVSTASGLVSTAGMAGVSTASGLVSTVGITQEVEINIPSPVATKDKGKAVMQESEPPKKIKKRVQIQMSIDEELAQKLHEEEQARFNA